MQTLEDFSGKREIHKGGLNVRVKEDLDFEIFLHGGLYAGGLNVSESTIFAIIHSCPIG